MFHICFAFFQSTEPWRFVALKRGAPVDRLLALKRAALEASGHAAGLKKLDGKLPNLAKAAWAVVICVRRAPDPRKGKLVREWEELAAVACAVQNFHLALAAAADGTHGPVQKSIVSNDATVTAVTLILVSVMLLLLFLQARVRVLGQRRQRRRLGRGRRGQAPVRAARGAHCREERGGRDGGRSDPGRVLGRRERAARAVQGAAWGVAREGAVEGGRR